MSDNWQPCSDCASAYHADPPRFSNEQAEDMYHALLVAYGLTSGMEDDWRDAGFEDNSSDISTIRRHLLASLRQAGFGGKA